MSILTSREFSRRMLAAQEAVRALEIPEARKSEILSGNARKILGLE